MKGSFKLHDLQAKKAQEDEWAVPPQPCTICSKMLAGAYGRWLQADDSEVWTCSKSHEDVYKESRHANP